jgi:hypothetical protein
MIAKTIQNVEGCWMRPSPASVEIRHFHMRNSIIRARTSVEEAAIHRPKFNLRASRLPYWPIVVLFDLALSFGIYTYYHTQNVSFSNNRTWPCQRPRCPTQARRDSYTQGSPPTCLARRIPISRLDPRHPRRGRAPSRQVQYPSVLLLSYS